MFYNKYRLVPIKTFVLLLPLFTYAQDPSKEAVVDKVLVRVKNTANFIVGLLFIAATIVFLWGIVKFIASSGDENARKNAKSMMFWGIIGLAVMVAAWGIVEILMEYFFIGGSPTFRPTPF